MSQKTIEILPESEIRVVKVITIIAEFKKLKNVTDISIGHIVYRRRLTKEYEFKKTEEENRDFLYYLSYPTQDMYPVDDVDGIILQAIKNTFAKSTVRNYSLISSTDKENIQLLENKEFEKANILFSPNFANADISTLHGRRFPRIIKDIKIYNDYRKDEIQRLAFYGYYALDDTTIAAKLDDVEFE